MGMYTGGCDHLGVEFLVRLSLALAFSRDVSSRAFLWLTLSEAWGSWIGFAFSFEFQNGVLLKGWSLLAQKKSHAL